MLGKLASSMWFLLLHGIVVCCCSGTCFLKDLKSLKVLDSWSFRCFFLWFIWLSLPPPATMLDFYIKMINNTFVIFKRCTESSGKTKQSINFLLLCLFEITRTVLTKKGKHKWCLLFFTRIKLVKISTPATQFFKWIPGLVYS